MPKNKEEHAKVVAHAILLRFIAIEDALYEIKFLNTLLEEKRDILEMIDECLHRIFSEEWPEYLKYEYDV